MNVILKRYMAATDPVTLLLSQARNKNYKSILDLVLTFKQRRRATHHSTTNQLTRYRAVINLLTPPTLPPSLATINAQIRFK